jgi:hypothetical protein
MMMSYSIYAEKYYNSNVISLFFSKLNYNRTLTRFLHIAFLYASFCLLFYKFEI